MRLLFLLHFLPLLIWSQVQSDLTESNVFNQSTTPTHQSSRNEYIDYPHNMIFRRVNNSRETVQGTHALSSIIRSRKLSTVSSLSHSTLHDHNANHVIAARQVANSSLAHETTVDTSKLSETELEKALDSAAKLASAKRNATEAAENDLRVKQNIAAEKTQFYEEKKRKFEELDGIAKSKEASSAGFTDAAASAKSACEDADLALIKAKRKVATIPDKIDAYTQAHPPKESAEERVADADAEMGAVEQAVKDAEKNLPDLETASDLKLRALTNPLAVLNKRKDLHAQNLAKCTQLEAEIADAKSRGDSAAAAQKEALLVTALQEAAGTNSSVQTLQQSFDGLNKTYIEALQAFETAQSVITTSKETLLILRFLRADADAEVKRAAREEAELPLAEAHNARLLADQASDDLGKATTAKGTADGEVTVAETKLSEARTDDAQATSRAESLKQAIARARSNKEETSSAGTTTIVVCVVVGLIVAGVAIGIIVLLKRRKARTQAGTKTIVPPSTKPPKSSEAKANSEPSPKPTTAELVKNSAGRSNTTQSSSKKDDATPVLETPEPAAPATATPSAAAVAAAAAPAAPAQEAPMAKTAEDAKPIEKVKTPEGVRIGEKEVRSAQGSYFRRMFGTIVIWAFGFRGAYFKSMPPPKILNKRQRMAAREMPHDVQPSDAPIPRVEATFCPTDNEFEFAYPLPETSTDSLIEEELMTSTTEDSIVARKRRKRRSKGNRRSSMSDRPERKKKTSRNRSRRSSKKSRRENLTH